MPVTLTVNFLTVVHKASGGTTMAFPDVCKTPTPAGPVPIPYPNISQSTNTAQGSTTVKVDGNPIMLQGSNFSMSTGDEAGSVGGVVSNTIKGKSEFINQSFDVKVDGKNVPRQLDPMLCNKTSSPNTPPAPELQAPQPPMPPAELKAPEYHVVLFFASYKHPDALTKRTVPVEFESPHKLSGPQAITSSGAKNYGGSCYRAVAKGDYTLEFTGFKRSDRPLKPPKE